MRLIVPITLGILLSWATPPPGRAADLEATLAAQGQLIEALQAELERVRAEQRESQDRVRALEDRLATPSVSAGAPDGSVTADWVDERIRQFETADDSRFFMSGYASSTFLSRNSDPSTFDAQFNPIFHFRLTDRLHFNAELQLQVAREDEGHETDTNIDLEYSTIDFLATDWLTVSAGKFLVPFNTFGPRQHPQWINKMVSAPPIYGGHHGGGPGIVPIMSDIGVMLSGGAQLWNEDSKFNYQLYATNGWSIEEEEHHDEEEEEEEEEHHAEAPELVFENAPDDNGNKQFGGRVGFLPIPDLELGVSYLTGKTRGEGGRYELYGADAWFWHRGLELRAEMIRLSRDLRGAEPDMWGYYAQAAIRLSHLLGRTDGWRGTLGKFEPVVRWGEVLDAGEDNREQIAVGMNYWLFESVPVKFTYEFNDDAERNERFLFQLAYGF